MTKLLPCGRPRPIQPKITEDAQAHLGEISKRLEEYALSKGLNRSEAREKILETIVYEARHFRPQDLLDRLRKRYPEVGKATVYRNLPVLVESGVIQEGPTDADGQILYELLDQDHHDHIVCLDCRKIFEFHDEMIEKRQEQVAGKLDFVPKTHRHVVYASCSYFQRNKAGI